VRRDHHRTAPRGDVPQRREDPFSPYLNLPYEKFPAPDYMDTPDITVFL
jgi:hypothetical protein